MKISILSNFKTKLKIILIIFVVLLSCLPNQATHANTRSVPSRNLVAGDAVYFYNSIANWNTVRLYVFNSVTDTGCTDWANRYTMQSLDNDGNMYKYILPEGINSCNADSVIFSNNDGDQTIDLSFAGTNYAYVVNGGSTGARTGFWYEMERVRIMQPGDIIYFDNSGLTSSGWNNVKIHLFSDLPDGSDATTWGNLPDMTQIPGTDIWQFVVPEELNTVGHKVNQIVFTNGGSGNDTQTIDLGFIESDLVYKVTRWENYKGRGTWYIYSKALLREAIANANAYINKLRCVSASEYTAISQAIQRAENVLNGTSEITIKTDPTAVSGDYWNLSDIEIGDINNSISLVADTYGEDPTICTFSPTITKTILNPQTEYQYGDVVRFKIDVTNVPAANDSFAITINLQENLAGAEFIAGDGYNISSQADEATATIAANQTVSFYANYEITDDVTELRTNTATITSAVPADNRYDLASGTYAGTVSFSTKSWDDVPVPTGIENNSTIFIIPIFASGSILICNFIINRRKHHKKIKNINNML